VDVRKSKTDFLGGRRLPLVSSKPERMLPCWAKRSEGCSPRQLPSPSARFRSSASGLSSTTPRAHASGAAFAVGWVLGLAALSTIVVLVLGNDVSYDTESGIEWLRVMAGIVFFLMAAQQWKKRPRDRDIAEMPKWMDSITSITAPRAVALGAARPHRHDTRDRHLRGPGLGHRRRVSAPLLPEPGASSPSTRRSWTVHVRKQHSDHDGRLAPAGSQAARRRPQWNHRSVMSPATPRNAPDRIRTCDLRFRRPARHRSTEPFATPMWRICDLTVAVVSTEGQALMPAAQSVGGDIRDPCRSSD
jgi:hypothetical protein